MVFVVGYLFQKFRPVIEYLVSTPDMLWWAMVIFTLVEGIVGLLYMLGFFTRLMSIGIFQEIGRASCRERV